MTPIFSRSWFVKSATVPVRLSVPASLRSAWLMSRACSPTWLSPISPSISAFGVSAATESTATTSSAPLRLGHDVVDERRLPRGLGAEDLDHPAPRQTADPERDVEREGARRDGRDGDLRLVA